MVMTDLSFHSVIHKILSSEKAEINDFVVYKTGFSNTSLRIGVSENRNSPPVMLNVPGDTGLKIMIVKWRYRALSAPISSRLKYISIFYLYLGSLQLLLSSNTGFTLSSPQIFFPAFLGLSVKFLLRSSKYRLIASIHSSTD